MTLLKRAPSSLPLLLLPLQKRLQSTCSKDVSFEFISSVAFSGKPVSEYELLRNSLTTKRSSAGFQGWVEGRKQEWLEDYKKNSNNLFNKPTPTNYQELIHSGQDWWFINQRKVANCETFLGVADGVGGWLDSGVDPSEVSQGLMFHIDQYLTKDNSNQETTHDILARAYEEVMKDDDIGGGASTALIAKLDPKLATLQWSNLGDSTLMLIRTNEEEDKIITSTKSQTHYFNCPYQLTKLPRDHRNLYGDEIQIDTPVMAESGTVTSLQDGDLVLLYTDGVGDNLFPDEILRLVRSLSQQNLSDHQMVFNLAHTICRYARTTSLDRNRVSPFEVAAKKEFIQDFKGGKVDDVTITVTLVRSIESLASKLLLSK